MLSSTHIAAQRQKEFLGALREKNLELADALIRQGKSLGMCAQVDEAAGLQVLKCRDASSLKWLLEHGLEVTHALVIAAMRVYHTTPRDLKSHPECLCLLIASRKDDTPFIKSEAHMQVPVIVAARRGFTKMVAALIGIPAVREWVQQREFALAWKYELARPLMMFSGVSKEAIDEITSLFEQISGPISREGATQTQSPPFTSETTHHAHF